MVVISGKAYVFGDDIDTDQIIPGRYLHRVKPEDIALHVMEGTDPGFTKRFARGSLIVAGKNFGCGSSREHAPVGLKAAGVACIIAESFGRIFYRNALNIGLPLLRCHGISEAVVEGARVSCDLARGLVNVETGDSDERALQAEKLSPEMIAMVRDGGLVSHVREELLRRPRSQD